MKLCTKCGIVKSFDSFAKNKAKKDGLQSMCRECKKIADHNNHKLNSDAQKMRNIANKQIRIDYANSKKSVPCMDCGQQYHPFVMDFDHVRGDKIGNVSTMVRDIVTMEILIAEIEKCDVVCANCHRARTWDRMKSGSVVEM